MIDFSGPMAQFAPLMPGMISLSVRNAYDEFQSLSLFLSNRLCSDDN